MAPLPGAAVDAGVDLAVEDDARADAGAQGHQDQALNVLVLVVIELPQGGAVRVVAQMDGHVRPFAVEHLRHRHGPNGDVHGLDDHAPPVVHRAGEAHAHGRHLVTGHVVLLHQGDGHVRQGLPHLLHGEELQGLLLGGGDLIALVYQTGLQVGPADVDTDIIHAISSFGQSILFKPSYSSLKDFSRLHLP